MKKCLLLSISVLCGCTTITREEIDITITGKPENVNTVIVSIKRHGLVTRKFSFGRVINGSTQMEYETIDLNDLPSPVRASIIKNSI